jgi:hypothetical protein
MLYSSKISSIFALSASILGFTFFFHLSSAKAECLSSEGGNNCATFDPSTPSKPKYKKLPVKDLDPNLTYTYAGVGVDISSPDPSFFLSLSDIFISHNLNQTSELFFTPALFNSSNPSGTTNLLELGLYGLPNLTVSNLDDFVISYTIPKSNSLNALIPTDMTIDTYLVVCPNNVVNSCVRGGGPSRQRAVSVPGPLPLFGVGAAFSYSRKLRNRTKSINIYEVMSAQT